MSASRVAVVQEMYQRLGAGDLAGARAMWTEDGVWHVTGGTGAYSNLQGDGTLVGTYFPGDGCNATGIVDHYDGVMKG